MSGGPLEGEHVVVRADRIEGPLSDPVVAESVESGARGMLRTGTSGLLPDLDCEEHELAGLEVFVASFAPAPRMFIFGAIDFAAALAKAGKLLGFHVTVVDPRAVFATRERFPDADRVVIDWPHRWLADQHVDSSTVICVLTHDPKFDVPALEIALRTDSGFVGAMGSRRTHDDRIERLAAAGLSPGDLKRLHSPIGLDIGASTPEETAIAIAAEIVQSRLGGTGQPLSDTAGPIHHRAHD